jgi:hypothetical protein
LIIGILATVSVS